MIEELPQNQWLPMSDGRWNQRIKIKVRTLSGSEEEIQCASCQRHRLMSRIYTEWMFIERLKR